jgi:chromosome segregation ATPase
LFNPFKKVEVKEPEPVLDLNKNDEYKTLRFELNEKKQIIASLQGENKQTVSKIDELKKQIETKERTLADAQRNEASLSQKLTEAGERLSTLNRKLDDSEQAYRKLKLDFDGKLKTEAELRAESARIGGKFADVSAQLKEKLGELEFLNRENNTLQERITADEAKIKTSDEQIKKLKYRIDDLNFEVDSKNNELAKIESLILSKETEIGDFSKKLNNRELQIKWKLEEFERNKKELDALRINYADLMANMNDQVTGLNHEIEALGKDKDLLQIELAELRSEHDKCLRNKEFYLFFINHCFAKSISFLSRYSDTKNELIEQEIDHEKAMLQKLEGQALNAKYENKIQYLEVETDTLRSKIRKLLKVNLLFLTF